MSAFTGQVKAEIRLILRDKGLITFALVFPMSTVVFFAYLNRGGQIGQVPYASFLIPGGVGMMVVGAAFENLGVTLARQRDEGILKRLGGTPLRPSTLVGAKLLAIATLITFQAVVLIAVNVVLFKAQITGSLWWGLVTMLVGVFAFATMGLALAGLSRNTDVAAAMARALSLPMQFLCGTLFPLEAMPPVLRHIAQALPLTYFVSALRGAMLFGDGPMECATDWLVLLGCLSVAFAVAVKTFRWE